MCNKNQLHAITTTVAAKSAELLNTKLQTVILYGSYASNLKMRKCLF